MKLNFSKLLIILFSLLVPIITAAIFLNINRRGAQDEQELVSKYLDALSQNNIREIIELTPKTHDADAEAQEKLKKFGGFEFQNVQANYIKDFSPYGAKVEITGLVIDNRGQEIPFYENIAIEKMGKRWYLILGWMKEEEGGIPPNFPSTEPTK